MPQIGEVFYYRRSHNHFVQKSVLLGESSRRWMIGAGNEWWAKDAEKIPKFATKLPKKTTLIETAESYELSKWASTERWKIREKIDSCTPEQLKKVAEIIGYET